MTNREEPEMEREVLVRGERVMVVGDKPSTFTGLGASDPRNTVLVRYPDGEHGAVPPDAISELEPEPDA